MRNTAKMVTPTMLKTANSVVHCNANHQAMTMSFLIFLEVINFNPLARGDKFQSQCFALTEVYFV